MARVRTRIRPDLEQEVDDREAYGLRQGGLLVDDDVAPATDPSTGQTDVAERDHFNAADERTRESEKDAEDANKQAQPKSQAKTSKNERS